MLQLTLIFSFILIIYAVWHNSSVFAIQTISYNYHHKNKSSFIRNLANSGKNRSIKSYFLNIYYIKYGSSQQLFRFDEQSTPIVINSKLHVIISFHALDVFKTSYEGNFFNYFHLYIHLVS